MNLWMHMSHKEINEGELQHLGTWTLPVCVVILTFNKSLLTFKHKSQHVKLLQMLQHLEPTATIFIHLQKVFLQHTFYSRPPPASWWPLPLPEWHRFTFRQHRSAVAMETGQHQVGWRKEGAASWWGLQSLCSVCGSQTSWMWLHIWTTTRGETSVVLVCTTLDSLRPASASLEQLCSSQPHSQHAS